ncbi:MAG: nucleoside deaminase [Bacteroidales bacterium]|nr:nucleoside deaminase [Bacteroidales bacterium]
MDIIDNPDIYYMREALREARAALSEDEVPIGAVVVAGDKIIARAHNLTETLHDVTAHAEMLALTAAEEHIGAKYLQECTLYVTVEPCPMCAGAAGWTQVGRIVYGAADPKRGYTLLTGPVLHPRTTVTGGVLEDDCRRLMKEFFHRKRNTNS